MNITSVTGPTEVQIATLKALGAVADSRGEASRSVPSLLQDDPYRLASPLRFLKFGTHPYWAISTNFWVKP